jgi:putative transposase
MTSRVYTVPALNVDYANGISLWQHEVFKKWQARNFDKKHNPEGWLRAKDEIRRMVERDLHIKSTKTRKRVARYQEESEIGAVKAGKGKALLTSSQGTYARRVVSILGEDAVSEPVQFDYAENNLGTEEDEDIQEFTAIFKEEVRNE